VAQSGGRFLRRVESPAEAEQLGIAEASKAWVLAVAMEKIKQALRNKEGSISQQANGHQLSTLPGGSGTATLATSPAQPQVLAALLQQRMKHHKLRTARSRQKLVDMQISRILHQPPATSSTFLQAAPFTSTVPPLGFSMGGFPSGPILGTIPTTNSLGRPAVLPGLSLARIAAAEEHLQMVRNQELSSHVFSSLAGTRTSAPLAAPRFAPSNAESQLLDLLRLSGGTGGTMPTSSSFAPNMLFGHESFQSRASSDRKRKASDEFLIVSSSSASPNSSVSSHETTLQETRLRSTRSRDC
jgi:hypothetical protein